MDKAILLFVLIFVSQLVFSQNNTPIYNSSKSQKGSINNNHKFQPGANGLVDVIIEFNDAPILNYLKNSNGLKSATASFRKLSDNYHNKANDFVKELKRLNKSGNTVSFNPQIKKTYSKIFNGISIEVPPSVIPLLKKLPSVKDVHPNIKMEMSAESFTNFVGAERIWKDFGNEADSIVVAIIDTGIDYMHPALGGGFGKGFKVIGGYDFVDNDSDPMDDCGHGTLCAGLIAGNSDQLKGIAPKASLMAFKVISCKGDWVTSVSIIDAIEHCVDIDNTGNFKNNVDVVSISLSTEIPAGPNDPICRAVDNASELGVTFCVSAGNKSGFYLIGSPGSAKSAITVGACDLNSNLAEFNSNGPNISDFSNKPDVVAPGVGIFTTNINGGYTQASGTSISCPIVAGIAALIKKKHKGWSPEEIKSAIVNTARNISENVMAQGAGIVDAYKAYKINTTLYPSNLSFGFVEKSDGNWIKEITTKISNKNTVSQQYKIEVVNQTTGITITPSKNNFSLSGLEKQDLSFKLDVDNSKLPAIPEEPYTYYGRILIKGTIDTLQVPWAFIKSSKLVIKSDTVFSFQLLNSDLLKGYSTRSYDNDKTQEIIAPNGIYDLIVAFDQWDPLKDYEWSRYLVFKENMKLEGFDTIYISKKDAVHRILPKGITENGTILSTLPNYTINMMLKAPFKHDPQTYIRGFGLERLFASDFSDRYTVFLSEFQFEPDVERKIRLINHRPVVGLKDNIILENNILDYSSQNLNLSIPNVKGRPLVYLGALLSYPVEEYEEYSCEGGNEEFLMYKNNWQGKFLYTPGYSKDFFYSLHLESRDDERVNFYREYFTIQPFIQKNDSLRTANHVYIKSTVMDYLSPNKGTINLGISPIYPNIIFSNSLTRVDISACPASTFRGALNEDRYYDYAHSTYTIKNGNSLIKSGQLIDFVPVDLRPALYTFEVVNTNYQINGITGKATLLNTMNFNSTINNIPPFITSMQIRNSENVPVDQIHMSEKCTLRISISDGKTFQAFVRLHKSEQWHELKVSETKVIAPNQNLYSLELTPYIGSDLSSYDIRIISGDDNSNSFDYKLEPAFVTGNLNSTSTMPITHDDFYTLKPDKSGMLVNKENGCLSNDEASESLIAYLVKPPRYGTLELQKDGSFTYVANDSFWYNDNFSYQAISKQDTSVITNVRIAFNANKIPMNSPPKIISQSEITTTENTPVEFLKSALEIEDFDNNINNIKINIRSGDNYTVNNNFICPKANFYGDLIVPITADDGEKANNLSEVFSLKITIKKNIGTANRDNLSNVENLFVYPNPFDNYLVFDYMSLSHQEIIFSLINVNGEIILEEKYQVSEGKNNLKLRTAQLNPGMYFYQLSSKNQCNIGKLILQRLK